MNTSEFRYCEVVGEATGKLLGEPLDPRLISHTTDEEDGFKKSHLTGHTVIAQLNRIFGYGGHSWEVTSGPSPIGGQGRSVDANTGEMLSPVGYACAGRLTVKTKSGPVSFDGVGVESLDDDGTFGAQDRAIKGAETDAMKRAARHLGTQFGSEPVLRRRDWTCPPTSGPTAARPPRRRSRPSRPTRLSPSLPPSRGGRATTAECSSAAAHRRSNAAAQRRTSAAVGSRSGAGTHLRSSVGTAKRTGSRRTAAASRCRDLRKVSREEAEGLLVRYARGQGDDITEEMVRQQVVEDTGKPLAEVDDEKLHGMIASAYRKLWGK